MYISQRFKSFRENGDTIVEVLIAIAVISLILGGAYATTNRSLLATRSAEERSIALKLAESQVEQIKGLAKTNPTSIFDPGIPNPFCINSSGVPIAASSDQCKVNRNGTPVTTEPRFTLSVLRANDGNTFTVTNQWTDIRGQITDNVKIIYRVYE